MKAAKLLILTISLIVVNIQCITLDGAWIGKILLNGESYNGNCDEEITFPATVPGGIYTDLNAANVIPDNLVGMNDIKNRWVGNQSVTYSRSFTVSKKFLNVSSTNVLIFHGLDTFATVFLNGYKIGESSNMFLKYIFDTTEYLKAGENNLTVLFYSPVKVALDLYKQQGLQYIVPPECVPKEYKGECHVNHIRKMQASFAWDWGPAFPSIGIWKSVELLPIREAVVTNVAIDTLKKKDTWKVIVTAFLEVPSTRENQAILCDMSSSLYIFPSFNISNSTNTVLQAHGKQANISIILFVPAKLVYEWWPNGYGEQHLYTIKTTVLTSNYKTRKYKRIGFRTIELIQEPLQKGLSFYFRVNGIPIFAKGSNFIPASIFPELAAKQRIVKHLLLSAKEAHMNMLRVWGGGMYESDLFYDLADEYGIMIWQDFMFACAMYPTGESFLHSVKEEVLQNILRLKSHASIALWAGNNENEAALYGNWYGTSNSTTYKEDYIKLYVSLIKREVEKLDPVRTFVVSSPSNGLHTAEYDFIGENPYSNLYGDVHYYNYVKNGWDINQYPRARFSSEYGFQSIPSIYTMLTAAERIDDMQIDSDFMKHRQHLAAGNQLMKALISKNFMIPQSKNVVKDLTDFIYLTQINQAVSVKIQTESYRQARSEVNNLGEGFTMGALYWQLNDVWQAPSWSSIDFEGRWKMLHYYATEFFAPLIVTSHLSEADELSLYVVSDKLHAIINCTVKVSIYEWNSMTPIHTITLINLTVEPNQAKLITSMWLGKVLARTNCGTLATAKKHCIIKLTLENHKGSLIAPINYVYPVAPKESTFPLATVTMNVNTDDLPWEMMNYWDFEVELTTDNIALFVWLEIGSVRGHFSENGFHMFEKEKRLIFHAYEATSARILQRDMKITTLSDIYRDNRTFDTNIMVHNVAGDGK